MLLDVLHWYLRWNVSFSRGLHRNCPYGVEKGYAQYISCAVFATSENVSVGRCGVVGSTLAFGSIGHESEHRLFSHHGA